MRNKKTKTMKRFDSLLCMCVCFAMVCNRENVMRMKRRERKNCAATSEKADGRTLQIKTIIESCFVRKKEFFQNIFLIDTFLRFVNATVHMEKYTATFTTRPHVVQWKSLLKNRMKHANKRAKNAKSALKIHHAISQRRQFNNT